MKKGSPSDTTLKKGSPSDTTLKKGSPSDTTLKKGSPSDTTIIINGKTWQNPFCTKEKNMDWDEAQEYCQNVKLDGHADWRLPTQKELEGLHKKRSNLKDYHWSSSHNNSDAWVVNFANGKAYFHSKSNKYNVLCVRDGE